MDWGFELWDQFDLVINHAHRNHEHNERVIHFFKERCSVERDYAKSLKKLINNFNQKKKDDDEFTVDQGLSKCFKEVFDLAGQHETIADRISESIIKNLISFQGESKQSRKRSMQEGARLQSQLQLQKDKLDKAKRKYEKAYAEAEKAVEVYKRNEQDINLAKVEIEKSRQVMEGKQQSSEECKKDYAFEVNATNKQQQEHFYKLMPEVFAQLQQQEEVRGVRVKESIETMASIETDVVPIVNRCIEGLSAAAKTINPKEDLQLMVEKYKTGFAIPGDIPFEDLSNGGAGSSGNNQNSNNNNHYNNPFNNSGGSGSSSGKMSVKVRSSKRAKASIFGKLIGKTDETKEDFSHLPPNQQRKKLLSKLENIKSDLCKLTQEREALEKMRDVYTKNKSMGDPASIAAKLNENHANVQKLEAEQAKFKAFLADVGRTFDSSPGNSPAMTRRLDDDADSVHSRVSTISIGNQQQGQQQYDQQDNSDFVPPPPPLPQQQQQHQQQQHQQQQQLKSFDTRQDSFSDDDDDFNDDDFNDQAGSKCTALYDYEGAEGNSSLAMVVGEVFEVLQDEGDGWMKVRKPANGDIGYVPSSYVKVD